jgi:hypothetical protein
MRFLKVIFKVPDDVNLGEADNIACAMSEQDEFDLLMVSLSQQYGDESLLKEEEIVWKE